jgi:hypothetical protein
MSKSETYLVNEDDFTRFKLLSPNIGQEIINQAILDSQWLDLRPWMNEAFFFDFISKFDDSGDPQFANYQNLLNGSTYTLNGNTVRHKGLLPAIVYFAYGRLLAEVGLSVSKAGVHRKDTAESTPVDGTEMRKHEQEAKAKAMSYLNSAQTFLDTEIDKFPLFREPRNINSRAYTGFNFTKV